MKGWLVGLALAGLTLAGCQVSKDIVFTIEETPMPRDSFHLAPTPTASDSRSAWFKWETESDSPIYWGTTTWDNSKDASPTTYRIWIDSIGMYSVSGVDIAIVEGETRVVIQYECPQTPTPTPEPIYIWIDDFTCSPSRIDFHPAQARALYEALRRYYEGEQP